jgi:hypothetical protein
MDSNTTKGGFSISFKDGKNYEHFLAQLEIFVTAFSSLGSVDIQTHSSGQYISGQYETSISRAEVGGVLQFAVNRTFRPTLTILSNSAKEPAEGVVSLDNNRLAKAPSFKLPRTANIAAFAAPFVLNFTVKAKGLSRDTQLLLTFIDPNNTQLFQTQFPTAWRVIYFAKGNHNSVPLTYTSQLAIFGGSITQSNLVTPTTWADVSMGDVWTANYTNNTYQLNLEKRKYHLSFNLNVISC